MKNGKHQKLPQPRTRPQAPTEDPRDSELANLRRAAAMAAGAITEQNNTLQAIRAAISRLNLRLGELESRPPWVVVVALIVAGGIAGAIIAGGAS